MDSVELYSKCFKYTQIYTFEYTKKGFRTKARDWDFIVFIIQMTEEFFKNFEILVRNAAVADCEILMEFFNNFDQNTGGKL